MIKKKYLGIGSILALTAGLFLMSSCQFEEVSTDGKGGMYFDVSTYLEKLTEEGFDTVQSVQKTVIRNGNREEQMIDRYALGEEWAMMMRNEINTKALQGRYDVDSSRMNGEVRVGYRAQDPSFAVDSLFVTRSYGSVRTIEWNQSIESIITDTRQQVIFRPESGFEVLKSIEPLIGQTDTFSIRLNWE